MAFSLDQFYQLNRRALIWLVVFGLLWLLRDFFGLVFITFALAFIALSFTRLGQRHLRLPYRVSLVGVYLLLLGALVSFLSHVTPTVISEANSLIGRLGEIQTTLVTLKTRFVDRYPTAQKPLVGLMRSLLDEESRTRVDERLAREGRGVVPNGAPGAERATGQETPTGSEPDARRLDQLEEDLLLDSLLAAQKVRIRELAPRAINLLYQGTVTVLLALLFSFLILVDFNRLLGQIHALRSSRLHDFYDEAAQPLTRLGLVVGRAIEAQAMIALVNTALTAVGLALLAVPAITVLSLIVFVCGFIPVLGTFISTTPIVLVALNVGGLGKAGAVIALIALVHAVEAYLLNPLIVGRHLNLNPVMVLIILFMGHHLFGIWGMVLGVPVTLYVLSDVFGVPLSYASRSPTEETTPAPP
jgi:predicted PurR-regulated permease PerM